MFMHTCMKSKYVPVICPLYFIPQVYETFPIEIVSIHSNEENINFGLHLLTKYNCVGLLFSILESFPYWHPCANFVTIVKKSDRMQNAGCYFYVSEKTNTHMHENSIQMTIRALEKMREH